MGRYDQHGYAVYNVYESMSKSRKFVMLFHDNMLILTLFYFISTAFVRAKLFLHRKMMNNRARVVDACVGF